MIFIAVATLFISLFSPFLGYIFLVSIGWSVLLTKQQSRVFFYAVISIGIIGLYLLRTITILEVYDILGAVLIVSWIFMMLLTKDGNYTKAMYFACLGQLTYGIFRTFLFSGIYRQRIEMVFEAYENIFHLSSSQTFLGNSAAEGQLEAIIEQVKMLLLDYQMAIGSIMMIFAVYLAALFFSRRARLKWQHHQLRFQNSLSYLLIIALLMAIIPYTRLVGINITLIIAVMYLIQGLSIIDYWCKRHLNKSRFVMLTLIVLMFLNVFLALLVSLLGLIDNWLDIRKINRI